VILVMLGTPIEMLNMNGYAKKSAYILIISIVLNTLLNYMLIPVYGILGAGIATGIALVFSKVLGSYMIFNQFKIKLLHLSNNLNRYIVFVTILIFINSFDINSLYIRIVLTVLILLCYIGIIIFFSEEYKIKIIKFLTKE